MRLILLYIFIFIFKNVSSSTCKITQNPDCTLGSTKCNAFKMQYILCQSNSTSTHFITFPLHESNKLYIIGLKSSNPKSSLKIEWSKLDTEKDYFKASEAFNVDNSKIKYAIVWHKLIDYNDAKDTVLVDLHDLPDKHEIDMNKWSWSDAQVDVEHTEEEDGVSRVVYSTTTEDKGGSVNFSLSVSDRDQQDSIMPRLSYVGGLNVHIEIELSNLTTSFKRSRFAAQFALLATEHAMDDKCDFELNKVKTINDESSPGIFTTYDVMMNKAVCENGTSPPMTTIPEAYFHFKPVCYTEPERDFKSSRLVFNGPLEKLSDPMSEDSAQHTRSLTLFFGSQKDGFYASNKYITWTSAFGFGQPPQYPLSAGIIALMISILVLATASVLAGVAGALILYRRRKQTVAFVPLEQPQQQNETYF